jgi:amino acid permease
MVSIEPRHPVLRASFVLFGTIVGAGIFGLPYVIVKTGYLVGLFWMIVLAGAVLMTHLMYAEIVLRTPGNHRLVGYVGIYLGPFASKIETVSSTLGLYGGSLAYLLLGGLFIGQLFSAFAQVGQLSGAFMMFLFGVAAVIWGTAFLSRFDFWLTIGEMSAFLLLSAIAFTAFSPGHLAAPVDWAEAFLPYGVVLFAYGGLSAVSEVRAMLGDRPEAVRKAVRAGTLMAAGLTILFVTAVIGALGGDVSEESVGGLVKKFGGALPIIGGATGFLSLLTSYVVFTAYLKDQFQHDFRWKPAVAAILAVGVPMILALIGVRSFGRIVELIGSVLIGIEGVFIGLMYLKIKKTAVGPAMKIPNGLVYLLMAVYGAGALYELFFRVFRGH